MKSQYLLKKLQEVTGGSQRDVAAALGVTQPTVWSIAHGKEAPTPMLSHMAKTLARLQARARLAGSRGRLMETRIACAEALKGGPDSFLGHIQECPNCLAKSYIQNGGSTE